MPDEAEQVLSNYFLQYLYFIKSVLRFLKINIIDIVDLTVGKKQICQHLVNATIFYYESGLEFISMW